MNEIDSDKWEGVFKDHILPSLLRNKDLLINTPAAHIVLQGDDDLDELCNEWKQSNLAQDRDAKIDWIRRVGSRKGADRLAIQERTFPLSGISRILGVIKVDDPYQLRKTKEFDRIKCSMEKGDVFPNVFLFHSDPTLETSSNQNPPPATYWIAHTADVIQFVRILADAHFLDGDPRGQDAKDDLADVGIFNSSRDLRLPLYRRGFRFIPKFRVNKHYQKKIDYFACQFTWEAFDAWGYQSFVDPDGSARFFHSGYERFEYRGVKR